MKMKMPSLADIQQFLKKYAMPVPALRNFLAIYFALRDPATPVWAKISLGGAVAYVLLLTDVVPDIIPVAGLLDDVGVLAATLATAASMYVREEHYKRADEMIAKMHIAFGNSGIAPGDQTCEH